MKVIQNINSAGARKSELWHEIQQGFATRGEVDERRVRTRYYLRKGLQGCGIDTDNPDVARRFLESRRKAIEFPSLEAMSQIYGTETSDPERPHDDGGKGVIEDASRRYLSGTDFDAGAEAVSLRGFVQNLRDAAPKTEEDEELIVAFDTDIGGLGEHNNALYEALSEVHSKKGFENLTIVTGRGSLDLNAKLAAQAAKAGKKTRVVIIGRQANIDRNAFSAFKDTARIVAVNDKGLTTEDGVYDISVTHIIEDVLRDENISLINFLEPEDARLVPTTELERRSKERAKFLRAA